MVQATSSIKITVSDLKKYNDMTNISVNKSNNVEGYIKINNQSSKSSMY